MSLSSKRSKTLFTHMLYVKMLSNAVHWAYISKQVFPKELRPVTQAYRANQLYRPIHHMGYALPDSRARFELFDRVVNVRSGISVPLGAKGTIIGKHIDTNNEVNTLYDIVFDEEFVGGVKLRCTPGKGFKLSPANLINITFGLKRSGKYEQFVSPGGQPLQTRAQHNYQPNKNRVNTNQRDQNNFRPHYGLPMAQRMPRPNMTQVFPNPVNCQTSLSIQTLNHSKTSPFQSPKHDNQSVTMDQLWKSMINNTNMLPKPLANNSMAQNQNPTTQTTQPKQILENKSRNKNQKSVEENKKAENSRQNVSQNKQKTGIQFVETCRQMLVRHCQRLFSQQLPKFDIVSFGPMKSKGILITLPDKQIFRTTINMHPSIDEAYEYVSLQALRYLNQLYDPTINLERPAKLLSSPSFMFQQSATQSSPNRPRIAESSLPRPPSRWIAQQRPVAPVLPFDRQPVIPESFVAHNNRILDERQLRNEEQRQQQRPFPSRENAFVSPNNQVRKKLFDHRNDSSQNTHQTQRVFANKNNQKTPKDGSNCGQAAVRRPPNQRQPSGSHTAFENHTAFVPLQVARNNQSHRSPNKSLSLSSNESNTLIEITSNSSEDVEILTPEAVVQISKHPSNDIEILTPESLSSPSADSHNRRQHPRKARLGVNLGNWWLAESQWPFSCCPLFWLTSMSSISSEEKNIIRTEFLSKRNFYFSLELLFYSNDF